MDPPLAPRRARAGLPSGSTKWPLVRGSRRLVGRFRGSETTKSEGLQVDLVPSESDFEPRSPRYSPCLVSGCWCTLRRFWGFLAPFWAVSRTYRGVEGH